MIEVNVHEAKTHLSRLLACVARGEEIVIARAGKPVARLVPVARPKGRRVLGRDKGKVVIADDFDAPLPSEGQAAFAWCWKPMTSPLSEPEVDPDSALLSAG